MGLLRKQPAGIVGNEGNDVDKDIRNLPIEEKINKLYSKFLSVENKLSNTLSHKMVLEEPTDENSLSYLIYALLELMTPKGLDVHLFLDRLLDVYRDEVFDWVAHTFDYGCESCDYHIDL